MDPIFEEMRLAKVDRERGVTIRADVWQRWQNTIRTHIQPELDAARHLVAQGFTVQPSDAQATVEARARARQREAR